jgi:hypothetical protein
MRPLYDARIEDLGPGDFLKVECAACGHYELVPPIGYGASLAGVYRQDGIVVGKVLNGANPADRPVEQPTNFEAASTRARRSSE